MDLPLDLIINILLRIPLKTLCTLKCVSKQWRNTICDHNFQNLHDELFKKRPKLLYATHSASRLSQGDPNISCPVTISSKDFFDGKIQNMFILPIGDYQYNLVTNYGMSCLFSDTSINICNPSTQEYIKLPDPPLPRIRYGEAIGYESISKEYKVVIFHKGDENVRAYIFSVRNGGPISDTWREIENLPSNNLSFSCATCVNGAIYWFIYDKTRSQRERMRICSFDLKDEVSAIIEIPSGIYIIVSLDTARMVDLKGFLGFVLQKHQEKVMSLWLLSKDKVWIKKYMIDPIGLGYHCEILGFIPSSWDGHEEEIMLLVWMSFDFMIYYNVANKSFRRVEHVKAPKYHTPQFYFDSFFSLGSRR